jgi:hypothetical protein
LIPPDGLEGCILSGLFVRLMSIIHLALGDLEDIEEKKAMMMMMMMMKIWVLCCHDYGCTVPQGRTTAVVRSGLLMLLMSLWLLRDETVKKRKRKRTGKDMCCQFHSEGKRVSIVYAGAGKKGKKERQIKRMHLQWSRRFFFKRTATFESRSLECPVELNSGALFFSVRHA